MEIKNLISTQRKKILILGGILFICIIVFVVISRRSPSQISQLPTSFNNAKPTSLPLERRRQTSSPPKVAFGSWKTASEPPVTKPQASVYTFRTKFPEEYINKVASTLNVIGNTQTKKNLVLTSNDRNALLFNTLTGSFTYYSKDGIALPISDSTEKSLYELLKNIGIYDDTMQLTATYKKQGQSNMTYYEIHRNWNVTGLPILNRFGIVNIPENTPLRSLTISPNTGILKTDTKIYATTDNSDGMARNVDFNTITIVQYNDRIISVISNMRPLDTSVVSIASLKDYTTALTDLQQGKIASIVTAPAGSGFTDWQKVYPDNIAKAKEAVVTDVVLTYLEDPLSISQQNLQPFYIFRGYAMAESGYRINFIASVKANVEPTGWLQFWPKLFSPVFALDGYQLGSQHQGTFELSVPPTVSPAIPSSIPTTVPATPGVCSPTEEQIQPIQDWEGIRVGYFGGITYSVPGGYYMVGADFATEVQLQEWINRALERHEDGNFTDKDEGGIRQLIDIMRELFTNPACPVRLTGPSPSLFVYSKLGKNYSVTPNFTLTYADPPMKNNAWDITQHMINEYQRKYIYYEYAPIIFSVPTEGWVTNKQDLTKLISQIGNKLTLNTDEQDRLYIEITNASKDITSQNMYLGFINQDDIDTHLPLQIVPYPEKIYRYHFYLTSHIPLNYSSPQLQPIERVQEMMVELGAVAYP